MVRGKRLKVKDESTRLKELVIPANAGIQGWGPRANGQAEDGGVISDRTPS